MGEKSMVKVMMSIEEDYIKDDKVQLVARVKEGAIKSMCKVACEKVEEKVGDEKTELVKKMLSKKNDVLKVAKEVKNNIHELKSDLSEIVDDISSMGNMIKNTQLLQVANIGISAANLVTTIVGFMIISNQLSEISSEMKEMKDMIRKALINNQLDIEKGIREVSLDYNELLDSDKRGKPFTENQYYELTTKLDKCIKYLYDVFMADAVLDRTKILSAIYTLLPMYSNVLKRYDTEYYYNNKSSIGNQQLLHLNHDNWMATFDLFLSKDYLQMFNDYWFVEQGCHYNEVELTSLIDCSLVMNCKQLVETNYHIMKYLDTREEYNAFQMEVINEAKAEAINRAKQLDSKTQSIINPKIEEVAQQLQLAY